MTRRIAMWSGPRNLSTAMMYAFGNRADTAASDEPFYGAYLRATGIDHPMRSEVLAAMPDTADEVAAKLLGPVPGGAPIWYQKHMTHHMVAGIPRDWMREVTNVFLIRHPARVIASYAAKREEATADDLGFAAQAQLLDEVRAMGQTPIVIDSADIRRAPKAALRALCSAIDIPFDDAMLSWSAGPRPYDGAWAPHWYDAVHRSIGFAGAEGALPDVQSPLLEDAMRHYSSLKAVSLKVA
ncbi:sulfotransferase-like domain-containing protein [Pseudaestuariivita sp.]|uniref:sulfotransferase-like domain-containing protein n=1 Tax=Pseudaestuariivita sp. TaxID=2211669 RepID=UPI004059F120